MTAKIPSSNSSSDSNIIFNSRANTCIIYKKSHTLSYLFAY